MFGLTATQLNALYNWIHGETGINTVFFGQSNNRLKKPLAVINITAPPKSNDLLPDKIRDGSTTVKTKFHKSMTVSIMVKDNVDAAQYTGIIEDSTDKAAVKTALKAAGLYCRYCLMSDTATFKLGDKYEYEAIIEFRFGATAEFDEDRYIIETVEIDYEDIGG